MRTLDVDELGVPVGWSAAGELGCVTEGNVALRAVGPKGPRRKPSRTLKLALEEGPCGVSADGTVLAAPLHGAGRAGGRAHALRRLLQRGRPARRGRERRRGRQRLVRDGALVRRVGGGDREVLCPAIHPAGEEVVVGDGGGSLRVYRLADGACVLERQYERGVSAVRFTDGAVWVGRQDGNIDRWPIAEVQAV